MAHSINKALKSKGGKDHQWGNDKTVPCWTILLDMSKCSLIYCSLAHFYLVQVFGGCDLKESNLRRSFPDSHKNITKRLLWGSFTNDPRVLSHLEHHQSTKDTCLMDRKRGPRVPDLMMFTMQGLAFFLFLLQLLWSAPIIVENIFCHGFDRFPDTCQILRYRSCD